MGFTFFHVSESAGSELCQAFMNLLLAAPFVWRRGVRSRLRGAPAARKFFDPACDYAPEGDFDVCADVDRYGFVLRLKRAGDGPAELERIDPPWAARG